MTKNINNCPKCGSSLEHIRMFNKEIFGLKNNPYIGYVCRNENCKGWYCKCCEEWHPYGTSCGIAIVRNTRDKNSNFQEEYTETKT